MLVCRRRKAAEVRTPRVVQRHSDPSLPRSVRFAVQSSLWQGDAIFSHYYCAMSPADACFLAVLTLMYTPHSGSFRRSGVASSRSPSLQRRRERAVRCEFHRFPTSSRCKEAVTFQIARWVAFNDEEVRVRFLLLTGVAFTESL